MCVYRLIESKEIARRRVRLELREEKFSVSIGIDYKQITKSKRKFICNDRKCVFFPKKILQAVSLKN